MKCAKPGCSAEAVDEGNFCFNHQPQEPPAIAKRIQRDHGVFGRARALTRRRPTVKKKL